MAGWSSRMLPVIWWSPCNYVMISIYFTYMMIIILAGDWLAGWPSGRLGSDPGGRIGFVAPQTPRRSQTLPAFLHPLHWRNEWRASIISYSRTQEEIWRAQVARMDIKMFDPGRNYKNLYGEPMIDVKGTFPDTFSILLEMQDSSNGAPGEGKLAVHCSQ